MTYLPNNERSPVDVLVPATFGDVAGSVELAETVSMGSRMPKEPLPSRKVFSKPRISR